MKQLGVHQAKTQFSRLLDEVGRGASYEITKHGRPVALLVPASQLDMVPASQLGTGMSVEAAIDGLRSFRAGRRLGETRLRELINDGRRGAEFGS